MHLENVLWVIFPLFVAGGSALISIYMMQCKMEVALSKEREALAEARAAIDSGKIMLEERVKATEETTKRVAMDEFMQDFRVEERSYARESKTASSSKKSMVMQERLFFRNIPLSNWIEREMVIEEGSDLNQLPRDSVFAPTLPSAAPAGLALVKSEARRAPVRIDEAVVALPDANEPRNLASVYMTAFGSN